MNFFNAFIYSFRKDFLIFLNYKFHIFMIFINILIILFAIFFIDQAYLFKLGSNEQLNFFLFLMVGIFTLDITVSCSNAIPLSISNMQRLGLIEEYITLETQFINIIISSIGMPLFLAIIKLGIYLLIGFIVFEANIALKLNFILIIMSLIIYAFCLAGIGMISGAFTVFFKKGNPIIGINTASTALFGGALYPTVTLNEPLQYISNFIPGKYFLDISRNGLNNSTNAYDIMNDFITLGLLTMGLFLIGFLFLHKSIKLSKKKNTILEY